MQWKNTANPELLNLSRGKQACPETLSPAIFMAQAEHAQVFPSTTLPFAPSALSLSWACPTPTHLPTWTTFNYPCSKCARLWRAFPYVTHGSLTWDLHVSFAGEAITLGRTSLFSLPVEANRTFSTHLNKEKFVWHSCFSCYEKHRQYWLTPNTMFQTWPRENRD